jgi:hypothetical protein
LLGSTLQSISLVLAHYQQHGKQPRLLSIERRTSQNSQHNFERKTIELLFASNTDIVIYLFLHTCEKSNNEPEKKETKLTHEGKWSGGYHCWRLKPPLSLRY